MQAKNVSLWISKLPEHSVMVCGPLSLGASRSKSSSPSSSFSGSDPWESWNFYLFRVCMHASLTDAHVTLYMWVTVPWTPQNIPSETKFLHFLMLPLLKSQGKMQEHVCRLFSYENETPFIYFCTCIHVLIHLTKAPLILSVKRFFHVYSHHSSPCATTANQLVMAKEYFASSLISTLCTCHITLRKERMLKIPRV